MKEANRPEQNPATGPWRVEIDFLYTALEACDRCLETDANLAAALSEVSYISEASGAEVSLRKTLVESESQARSLGLSTSPTIRINGKDIAPESRESNWESCSCNGAVGCRVWVFRGREYTAAPKAMIVDAILREVYGRAPLPPSQTTATLSEVPEPPRRFFAGEVKEGAREETLCCPANERATCCAQHEKTDCCGTADATGCGCT
jgi:hypothetical protein